MSSVAQSAKKVLRRPCCQGYKTVKSLSSQLTVSKQANMFHLASFIVLVFVGTLAILKYKIRMNRLSLDKTLAYFVQSQ